jgi:hypothetical protein
MDGTVKMIRDLIERGLAKEVGDDESEIGQVLAMDEEPAVGVETIDGRRFYVTVDEI